MAWQKNLTVVGNTFLEGYDSSNQISNSLTWQERCENTIETILSKHQPLASEITNNGIFLSKLISKIISKKQNGQSGLDLLLDFSEIDPEYQNKLFKQFRVERAARALNKTTPSLEAQQKVNRAFNSILKNPSTKAISFDIFDTLVCRPVEKPADLYHFLEIKALKLSNGIASNFGRVRSLCEVETRNKLTHKEEITLDDIYETVASFYNLNETQISEIKQAEIELEISVIKERPNGRKLFDMALASGKPVYLISDMYLHESVIIKMLDKTGYSRYKKLFVSSKEGCRKHGGKLYTHVLKQLNIAGNELAHVGDNKKTDIEDAHSHGINTLHFRSAIDWMRASPIFKEIYSPRRGAGERARSAVAGTTALGLFNCPQPKEAFRSFSAGNPEKLGYAILGPLLTGYISWLSREVKRDKISDLYFMAREGWLLKEAYNIMNSNDKDLPKGKYLFGSRRAIRVASCRTYGDVMAMASQPYDSGIPLNELLVGRFGIELTQERLKILEENSIKKPFSPLEHSFSDRETWQKACVALADDIIESAKTERDSYEAYLSSNGFYESDNIGIVDIGWKTNIQGSLSLLTRKNITGYYYATVQGSEVWNAQDHTHRAYIGLGVSPRITTSSVVKNRHLSEFLFCHSDRSLEKMALEQGNITPVFRPEKNHQSRKQFIEQLHNGALQFVTDFHKNYSDLNNQIFIDPALAESAFRKFSEQPSEIDAKLLMGYSFEDAVGGIPEQFIISPNKKNHESTSVWLAGAKVAHKNKKPNDKKAINKTVIKTLEAKDKTRNLEKRVLKVFLNKNKFNKYIKNRERFFEDSNSKLLLSYYRIS